MVDKLVKIAAVGCALIIGAVTFCLSYAHLASLARRAGQGELSDLWPLSTDLVLVASTLAMVAARRRRRQPGVWVWVGVASGITVSLMGNIVAAPSDLTSRAVAAWTPLALALAVELVIAALRIGPPETSTARPEPAAEPSNEGAGVSIPPETGQVSRAARVSPVRRGGRARGGRGRQPTAIGPELIARAARMISEQPEIGRGRLARQLGITEHVARGVMSAARSATTPSNGNGHLVLTSGAPPGAE